MKRQQDKLLIIIAMSGEMPTYLGQYVTGSISYTAALITRLKKERYIFVLTFWFLQTFNNSIVNKDFEIRAIIAETLYKLYDKIYYKKEVIQSINAKAYFLAENLQTRNINKFIHFDNDRQYLFSKLRGNVKRSLINA